ncbi:MAG: DegV family protein [Candidatus Heimdallarchaeaceae archaeon]
MKSAIVVDTSVEVQPDMFNYYDIYPIGYVVVDSKGSKYCERETIRNLRTAELRSLLNADRKAQLLAPSLKDFVELYTYLAEEFDHITSIHSALFTPAVFENAILAKKLVSGASIDIIETHCFGSASGLFLEQLARVISGAKRINEIRKAAINYNRSIEAYIIARQDLLHIVGLRKTTWLTGITATIRPFVLYHFYNGQWEEVIRARNTKGMIEHINKRLELIKNVKSIQRVGVSYTSDFAQEKESLLKSLSNIKMVTYEPSLIIYYLLNKSYVSIAFV